MNMKKFKILLVAGFVIMTAATAASAEGLYAGGLFGFSGGGGEINNSGMDLVLAGGFVFSGVVGKEFSNARLEGEIAYRQNDMDSYTLGGLSGPANGEMSSLAFMANGYYDFGPKTWPFRPYLGIGIGAANVTLTSPDYNDTDDSDLTFALQIIAGGTIAFSDSLAMTVDLRSFGAVPTFTDSFGNQYEQGYGVASVMVGLRQSF